MERITAALLAALLLSGCGQGETNLGGGARPASEAAFDQDGPAGTNDRDGLSTGGDAGQRPTGTDDLGAIGSDDADDADAASEATDPATPEASQETASPAAPSRSSASPADRPAQGDTQPTASQPGSQSASPTEVLRATSRAYEDLRSFRAEFEQTLQNTLLGRTTRSEGTLYQRQPDRFLMEFTDPENDRIVSDGRHFWMYFPSVDPKQVIRSSRGAQGLDLHSQFIGDPVERFEVSYHGTEPVQGRRAHVMTLEPRENMGYQRLKVWVDARDHLVRRFELTENNGNIRHFVLSDLVKNPTLPDDLFQFTPPPGAQVVDR